MKWNELPELVTFFSAPTGNRFFNVHQYTAHAIDIGWTSVRPTTRLSITRRYCVQTAQPIVRLSSLPGSPMILVF